MAYRILRENLGDFETYIGYVLDFIQPEISEKE